MYNTSYMYMALEGEGYRFTKFTPEALAVLDGARDSAVERQDAFIGTQHLLLGGLKVSRVRDFLANLGLSDIDKVVEAVNVLVPPSEVSLPKDTELSLTQKGRAVVELAVDESRLARLPVVMPHHLVLGLLREGQGIASVVLEYFGVTYSKALEAASPITSAHKDLMRRQLVVRLSEMLGDKSTPDQYRRNLAVVAQNISSTWLKNNPKAAEV